MRVTIIPEDQTILVDGTALQFAFVAPSNIHAIQWYGEHGTIEQKVGGSIPATLADVQPFIDAYAAEQARLAAIAATPATPEQIAATTRAQAKAARAAAVEAITVTVGGKVFDGDEASQGRMSRAIIGMQAAGAPTIGWTLANNATAEVTIAELTTALILAGQTQAALWPLP